MNPAPLMVARSVSVRFGGCTAVTDVSLELSSGDIVAIVGANGSGKSSLLRAVAGVAADALVGGEVRFASAQADAARARALLRAFVPQRPEVAAPYTVREVVGLGRYARGEGRGADERAVQSAIESVGLGARAGMPVHALSGGERQRVAIARALAQVHGVEGAVLLLDEPFAGIDPGEVARLVGVLRCHARSRGAVALTLHDPGLARAIASRALVLRDGRALAAGPAHEVLVPSILSTAYGSAIRESTRWLVPAIDPAE